MRILLLDETVVVNPLPDPTEVSDHNVEDAQALAVATLLGASPAAAAAFALAMHERLCERGDYEHAEIWLGYRQRLKDELEQRSVRPMAAGFGDYAGGQDPVPAEWAGRRLA